MNLKIKFLIKNYSILFLSFILLSIFSGCKRDQYRSVTYIYTGIKEPKYPDGFLEQFDLDIKHSSLEKFTISESSIKYVTLRLLIHDLKAINGESEATPFRTLKQNEKDLLTKYDVDSLIQYMELQLENFDSKVSKIKEENINKIALAFGYDYKTILSNFETEDGIDSSRFIQRRIEFTSENPELSHFALSNYCADFSAYYKYLQDHDHKQNVEFYQDRVNVKKTELEILRGFEKLKLQQLRNNIDTMIVELFNLKKNRNEINDKINNDVPTNLSSLQKEVNTLNLKIDSLELRWSLYKKTDFSKPLHDQINLQKKEYIEMKANLQAAILKLQNMEMPMKFSKVETSLVD